MSQDNASDDSAVGILTNPAFANNLKRWVNEKKIRHATKSIDFSSRDAAQRALYHVVITKPHIFHHDRVQGKTAWEICNKYYSKLASYVFKL